MRFLSYTKYPEVERVASKDDSRPVLSRLYLRILNPKAKAENRKGVIEATDSFRLVQYPVELHPEDTEGFISVDALKALKKATSANRYIEVHLVCLEDRLKIETPDGVQTWTRETDGQWPKFDSLIPDESELSEFRFGINAEFLAGLAKALGAKDSQVVVRFTRQAAASGEGPQAFAPSNLRPFIVTAHGADEGAVALAMPVRVAAHETAR